MKGGFIMKRKFSIIVATSICLTSIVAYGVINMRSKENIMLEKLQDKNAKVKVLDTEGIEFTDEYTIYDFIKENRDPEDIKPKKENDWWNNAPKNEAEAEFLKSVKIEKNIQKQISELKEKINNEEIEDNKKVLEDDILKLKEKWNKQHQESVNIMEKHGMLDK